MKSYSRAADALPRSGIREIMEIASRMDGVIHLEVGEPSFNTPPHIIEAALSGAHGGATKYTSNYGTPALRQLIADKYTRDWGQTIEMSQILVSSGGVNAIAMTLFALLEEGDEVLVPDPGWPNYISAIGLAHGRAVRYPLRPEKGYLPERREIERLLTPRTKALILCNPSNPTGSVFPAETVQAMVDFAVEHDLFVISDEIYEALVFDGVHAPASNYDRDGRVITIGGFSKTYAMTGWRLGYAIGNAELIRLAGKLMEPVVSCASAVSQKAGEAALAGPQDCVREMKSAYHRRRDIARDALAPAGLLPVVPNGAFYALVDLRACGMPSRELALAIFEEERIATAPGDTFGEVAAAGMVRLSLASSDEDVAEGSRRLVRFAETHALAGAAVN